MDKEEILKILNEVGLPQSEANVYISLLGGAKSVAEIMKITGEKRPTVYYSMNSLEKRGLVSKTGKEYGNKYQLESIERLQELVENILRKNTELLEKVEKVKKFYPLSKNNKKIIVSYFDTEETIKSAIFYSLYSKDRIIRTIVPGNNFFHQVGISFVEEYVKEKFKRNIKTKALWEDIPHKNVISKYYNNSEIKQIPIDMHNSFETTIFIYDDKTLYIAPLKENYAVLIQSKEHSKMMSAVFDNIWNNAHKIK